MIKIWWTSSADCQDPRGSTLYFHTRRSLRIMCSKISPCWVLIDQTAFFSPLWPRHYLQHFCLFRRVVPFPLSLYWRVRVVAPCDWYQSLNGVKSVSRTLKIGMFLSWKCLVRKWQMTGRRAQLILVVFDAIFRRARGDIYGILAQFLLKNGLATQLRSFKDVRP